VGGTIVSVGGTAVGVGKGVADGPQAASRMAAHTSTIRANFFIFFLLDIFISYAKHFYRHIYSLSEYIKGGDLSTGFGVKIQMNPAAPRLGASRRTLPGARFHWALFEPTDIKKRNATFMSPIPKKVT
jgi:hypothetical protein